MPKFMIQMVYSSASWARMLQHTDDRETAVAALIEHLDGKLESMFWEVENASAHVIGELPDSVSAAAVIMAATKTGAFKDVQVRQVLTQEQLRDVVALARSSENVFRPPGTGPTDPAEVV
jgi:uncharacterized protein with GYD domain